MENIKLYRKRYIPDEIIHLKDDIILFCDEEKIITKWNVLKPRKDFDRGYSCYFLKDNIKVSKMYKGDSFVYTYCDIVEHTFDENEKSYIFYDLLIDVIILPDGFVKVLDLGELPEALDKKMISLEQAKKSLLITENLLTEIYSQGFKEKIKCMELYE